MANVEPEADVTLSASDQINNLYARRHDIGHDEFVRNVNDVLVIEMDSIDDYHTLAVRQAYDVSEKFRLIEEAIHDEQMADTYFDQDRLNVAELINKVRYDMNVNLSTTTFDRIDSLNKDGFMTQTLGETGKERFRAARRDLAAKNGHDVKHVGVDFSKSTDVIDLATRVKERQAARSRVVSVDAQQRLDAEYGKVDETVAEPVKMSSEFQKFLHSHGRDINGQPLKSDSAKSKDDGMEF